MEPIITTEQIYNALGQSADLLWTGIEPVIMSIVFSMLFWKAIKVMLHKIHSFINIGLTAREERRAYKKIDNVVDGISSISDLSPFFKSDKGE